MQGKAHSPGHWTRCTGQIGTVADAGGRGVCPNLHSFGHVAAAQKSKFFRLLFFAKSLDFVNELVYNKDVNENIYKPHHETPKQEDKNHEKDR